MSERCYWTRHTDGLWYFIPECWSCVNAHDENSPMPPRETKPNGRPNECECWDSIDMLVKTCRRIHDIVDGHAEDIRTLRKMRKALEKIARETNGPDEEDDTE